MRILKNIFGGFLLFSLLVTAAPDARAIFSTPIASEIAAIKQHVLTARERNGTGGVGSAGTKLFTTETVKKTRDKDKEQEAKGGLVGLPGQFYDLRKRAKRASGQGEGGHYAESFALMFNRLPEQTFMDENNVTRTKPSAWITSCLRDDLFELLDLRDAVLRESLRSALMYNPDQAAILYGDYETLTGLMDLLKRHYDDSPGLFFEPGAANYYGKACPNGGFFGELGNAWEDFSDNWDVFWNLMTAGGTGKSAANGQWGSIWEMAKARAKVEAAEWVTKNQLSFTLGGEKGGDKDGLLALLKKEGTGGIGRDLLQQIDVFTNLIGVFTPVFDPDNYKKPNGDPRDVALVVKGIQNMVATRQQLLDGSLNALTFNLQFASIGEQSIKDIEKKMFDINTAIRRGYEAFGKEGGGGIQSVCKDLQTIPYNHCAGGAEVPVCDP